MSILNILCLDDRVIVDGASSGLGVYHCQSEPDAGADLVRAGQRAGRLVEAENLDRTGGRRELSAPTRDADPEQCDAGEA